MIVALSKIQMPFSCPGLTPTVSHLLCPQRSDYVAHVHAHARAVYYVKDKNLGPKVKILGGTPVPYAPDLGSQHALLNVLAVGNCVSRSVTGVYIYIYVLNSHNTTYSHID